MMGATEKMEVRYIQLRRRLDDKGYRDVLPIDSVPLIEKLFNDFVTASEKLQRKASKSEYFEKIAKELEEGVEPFKEENVRLVKENSTLRLSILKTSESVEERIAGTKLRLQDVEAENKDLKELLNQFVDRVKELEVDLKRKARKIQLLQERNLEAHITGPGGENVPMSTKKQRMEINRATEPLCPHCVRIKNWVEYGKNREPGTMDYIQLADSRIEALQLQLRQMKRNETDLVEAISCMKSKIDGREEEIQKLKGMIQIRPGGLQKDSSPCGEQNVLLSLKAAQMQLNILQLRNLQLEKKLQASIIKDRQTLHGKVTTNKSSNTVFLNDDYPGYDAVKLQEKVNTLEAQLSHCCSDKAKLKFLLEECESREKHFTTPTRTPRLASTTPEREKEHNDVNMIHKRQSTNMRNGSFEYMVNGRDDNVSEINNMTQKRLQSKENLQTSKMAHNKMSRGNYTISPSRSRSPTKSGSRVSRVEKSKSELQKLNEAVEVAIQNGQSRNQRKSFLKIINDRDGSTRKESNGINQATSTTGNESRKISKENNTLSRGSQTEMVAYTEPARLNDEILVQNRSQEIIKGRDNSTRQESIGITQNTSEDAGNESRTIAGEKTTFSRENRTNEVTVTSVESDVRELMNDETVIHNSKKILNGSDSSIRKKSIDIIHASSAAGNVSRKLREENTTLSSRSPTEIVSSPERLKGDIAIQQRPSKIIYERDGPSFTREESIGNVPASRTAGSESRKISKENTALSSRSPMQVVSSPERLKDDIAVQQQLPKIIYERDGSGFTRQESIGNVPASWTAGNESRKISKENTAQLSLSPRKMVSERLNDQLIAMHRSKSQNLQNGSGTEKMVDTPEGSRHLTQDHSFSDIESRELIRKNDSARTQLEKPGGPSRSDWLSISSDVEAYREEIKRLRTFMYRKEEEIDGLRKENLELERRLKSAQAREQLQGISYTTASEQDMEREIGSLKFALKALDRDKDDMRMELDKKDEKMYKLQNELAMNLDEIGKLQLRLKNSELQLGHTSEASRDQDRELVLAKRQLSNLRNDFEQMAKERDDARKEIRRLGQTNSVVELERRTVSVELETRTKETDDLKKQVQRYIEEVRRIEELLQNKEEEYDVILEHYRTLTVERTSLENTRSTLERETDFVKQEVREALNANSSLRTKLETQNSLTKSYEEEIEKLTQQVVNLEMQLANTFDSEKTLQSDSAISRDLCMKLENSVSKLRLELANAESSRVTTEAGNRELQEHITKLESLITDEQEKHNKLEELIGQVREKEFALQRNIEDLLAEKQDLTNNCADLTNKLETVKKECERYRLKATQLLSDLEKLQRQFQNEKGERESATEELKRIKQQLSTSSTNLLISSALDRSGSPGTSTSFRSPQPEFQPLSPATPTQFDTPLGSSTSRAGGSNSKS